MGKILFWLFVGIIALLSVIHILRELLTKDALKKIHCEIKNPPLKHNERSITKK